MLASHALIELSVLFSAETAQKLLALPGQKTCGVSGQKTGRIVGGEPAQLGKYFDLYLFTI